MSAPIAASPLEGSAGKPQDRADRPVPGAPAPFAVSALRFRRPILRLPRKEHSDGKAGDHAQGDRSADAGFKHGPDQQGRGTFPATRTAFIIVSMLVPPASSFLCSLPVYSLEKQEADQHAEGKRETGTAGPARSSFSWLLTPNGFRSLDDLLQFHDGAALLS